MIRFLFLFGMAVLSSSHFAFADHLVCNMDRTNSRIAHNAPLGAESELTDFHVIAYDLVRGDCDGGYSFEMEGFGPGLAALFGETFKVSCPFVKDFRGTYAGLRVHATALLGVQAATYVGTGVCFVYGFNGGIGGGASLGLLTIRHRNDVLSSSSSKNAKKNFEIPEETKSDFVFPEPAHTFVEEVKEREFDR